MGGIRLDTKAQRLEVAALIAPILRDNATTANKRRVKIVPREALTQPGPLESKVKKTGTLAEVQEGLLAIQKIELEVDDGVRPKAIVCACGAVRKVPTTGVVPRECKRCVLAKNSRKWSAKNKAKIAAKARKQRTTEKYKVRSRNWRAAHREKLRAANRKYMRKWAAEHPEENRAKVRKWRLANPEKAREMDRKKKATQRAAKKADAFPR